MRDTSGELAGETLPALISAAERAFVTASNFDEVKAIRDQADGLRAFAKKMGADTRKLDTIKIKAERIIGQQLKKQPKAKRPPGPGRGKVGIAAVPTFTSAPRLADLGISKKESSRWQQLADIPDEKFETYIATASEVSTEGALKINASAHKKARRMEREQELGEKTRAAAVELGKKTFGVILIDPPSRFEPYSRDTGMDRAADNHYPTMTFAELAEMKLPAEKNCVLFYWTAAPTLDQALSLTKIWGFTYKTHCVWLKTNNGKPWVGTGFWLRNRHEILSIATRGDVPAPAPGEQWLSVIEADIGKHSAKPSHFAELIEEMFPTTPRLEMFARGPRENWDVWGNEVEP